ncbi:dihydroneopterin aldolase [Aestuariimicrobium kwangyangense]|uniref:dihydroneopterin aldolase n=1 Tax=Aestuariimicrobium kwangyangense TaxID=396389 RepID=UPI0004034CCC|nr:dihydroneopterin aldolase [Aestuariimicrobium kwangyangense]
MTEPVTIRLSGVSATGRHGWFDFERDQPQVFTADAVLVVDCDTNSDDLAGTVDYGQVATRIEHRLGGDAVNLIETLASRIADDLAALPRVREAQVTVHKPHAPLSTPFTDVSVTVTRSTHGD